MSRLREMYRRTWAALTRPDVILLLVGVLIVIAVRTEYTFFIDQFATTNTRLDSINKTVRLTAENVKTIKADVKTANDALAALRKKPPLGTKIDHANSALADLQEALQHMRSAQAASAAFEFLGIVRAITQGATQDVEAQGEIAKAAGDIAAHLVNGFASGAGEALGKAVVKWFTCEGRCTAKREHVVKIIERSRSQNCNKNCQAKIDDLGGATHNQVLARVEAAISDLKQSLSEKASAAKLADVTVKLDNAGALLVSIKQTVDAIKIDTDAGSNTLNQIKNDTAAAKTELDQASASLATLHTTVETGFKTMKTEHAHLIKAFPRSPPQGPKPGPEVGRQNLIVIYVSIAGAPRPLIGPPLAVHYQKIGSVDDNGQTALIVSKLRTLVKGHSGCTIVVSGHSDTLGSDRANYELSKKRAEVIAGKLKTAFAGEPIAISQAQWGERRLKDWTPDNTPNLANRRVDIAVNCKG